MLSLEEYKEKILNLWRTVKRQGTEELISYLETSDFFTCPCSTKYHLAVPGGLAAHSLNVYRLLAHKVKVFNLNTPQETVTICALGHDLCKVNTYGKDVKNVKENGVWHEKEVYVVRDQYPYGHGEKSVSILQDYIKLNEEEKLAIRWHMSAFDAGIHFNYPNGIAFRTAANMYPLVTLLFTADYEASQIIERGM